MAQRDRAAYMREYRAKKRRGGWDRLAAAGHTGAPITAEPQTIIDETPNSMARLSDMLAENERLRAEVVRLKRELAARPLPAGFNTRPFTPVPKTRR